MDDLEEIKKRKLQEMMAQQEQQNQEHAQAEQQIKQLELVVGKHMTREALERYGNLKAAHPDKAMQLLVILAQLIQQGQISGKIDDDALKKLLIEITPKHKDIKIKRV